MSEYAWVTLTTNDSYSLGALVLAHSLKEAGTTHQLAVLITPGVTAAMREKLASVFNVIQEVNILDSKDESNLKLLKRPELGVTFTKLHCWRLTQFKKCVFLDADTLVLKNADELFERDEFSAAPDVGWPDCFNSGVFVYKPSNETFEKLVQFALEKGSFDGGDQGLLNLYFANWAHQDISKHLPFIYNMCSTACYSYLPAFKYFGNNVKIVHFIGATKPWLQYFDMETKQVQPSGDVQHLQSTLQHWWNLFCTQIHPTLSITMTRERWSNENITFLICSNHNEKKQKLESTTSEVQSLHSNYTDVWDPWEEYDSSQKETNSEPVSTNNSPLENLESHITQNKFESCVTQEITLELSEQNDSCSNSTSPTYEQNVFPNVALDQLGIQDQLAIGELQNMSDQQDKQPHIINDYPIEILVHNTTTDTKESDPEKPISPEVGSLTDDNMSCCIENEDDTGGLAGAFAQISLGTPKTVMQTALEDHIRRQCWESGNIDYMNRDSFDSIWKKINETLAAGPQQQKEQRKQEDNTTSLIQATTEAPIQVAKIDLPQHENLSQSKGELQCQIPTKVDGKEKQLIKETKKSVEQLPKLEGLIQQAPPIEQEPQIIKEVKSTKLSEICPKTEPQIESKLESPPEVTSQTVPTLACKAEVKTANIVTPECLPPIQPDLTKCVVETKGPTFAGATKQGGVKEGTSTQAAVDIPKAQPSPDLPVETAPVVTELVSQKVESPKCAKQDNVQQEPIVCSKDSVKPETLVCIKTVSPQEPTNQAAQQQVTVSATNVTQQTSLAQDPIGTKSVSKQEVKACSPVASLAQEPLQGLPLPASETCTKQPDACIKDTAKPGSPADTKCASKQDPLVCTKGALKQEEVTCVKDVPQTLEQVKTKEPGMPLSPEIECGKIEIPANLSHAPKMPEVQGTNTIEEPPKPEAIAQADTPQVVDEYIKVTCKKGKKHKNAGKQVNQPEQDSPKVTEILSETSSEGKPQVTKPTPTEEKLAPKTDLEKSSPKQPDNVPQETKQRANKKKNGKKGQQHEELPSNVPKTPEIVEATPPQTPSDAEKPNQAKSLSVEAVVPATPPPEQSQKQTGKSPLEPITKPHMDKTEPAKKQDKPAPAEEAQTVAEQVSKPVEEQSAKPCSAQADKPSPDQAPKPPPRKVAGGKKGKPKK